MTSKVASVKDTCAFKDCVVIETFCVEFAMLIY